MSFTIEQLQAAINSKGQVAGASRLTQVTETTKSLASKAAGGFVGMLPVTNKKFNGTVSELRENDAVASASIMSLVKQLQDLGVPVELNPEDIQNDAALILSQYSAQKDAEKELQKQAQADKVAAFKAKFGFGEVAKPQFTAPVTTEDLFNPNPAQSKAAHEQFLKEAEVDADAQALLEMVEDEAPQQGRTGFDE